MFHLFCSENALSGDIREIKYKINSEAICDADKVVAEVEAFLKKNAQHITPQIRTHVIEHFDAVCALGSTVKYPFTHGHRVRILNVAKEIVIQDNQPFNKDMAHLIRFLLQRKYEKREPIKLGGWETESIWAKIEYIMRTVGTDKLIECKTSDQCQFIVDLLNDFPENEERCILLGGYLFGWYGPVDKMPATVQERLIRLDKKFGKLLHSYNIVKES